MQPTGVHGSGAFWPRTSQPRLVGWSPSTSLAGSTAERMAFSSSPVGCCTMKPVQSGSSLSARTTARTSSSEDPAGRSRRMLRMPISAQSLCLAPTYQWLPGSSPTRTVPSPGTTAFGEGGHAHAQLVLDRAEDRLAVECRRCHAPILPRPALRPDGGQGSTAAARAARAAVKHSAGGVTSPAPTWPVPATLPAMPVLICGRMPVRRTFVDVDPGRRAAELQDRQRVRRVLGERDLVHRPGGPQRDRHLAADELDDRRRRRHGEPAEPGGLGDRGVADVRVGVVGSVGAEEQPLRRVAGPVNHASPVPETRMPKSVPLRAMVGDDGGAGDAVRRRGLRACTPACRG